MKTFVLYLFSVLRYALVIRYLVRERERERESDNGEREVMVG